MVKSSAKPVSPSPTLPCELTLTSNKYCPKNAYWLGKAARLVYQSPTEAQKAMAELGFNKFQFFDKNETQAFLAGNDQVLVLAFRGTTCIADWMTNKKITMTPAFGGQVHRGFLNALNIVWGDIESKIKEFRTRNQPLLVTGHSLGAALATLATATMLEKKIPVLGLYTFGSPRTGNTAFADKFNAAFKSQTFRFVNNNDIVTRIAPRSMSYGHVGTFVYFDIMGELQEGIEFWNQFLDSVKGKLEDFLQPGIDFIKDHDMGIYEKNLLKNIQKTLKG